jgi:transcriptional regulator with XRE-family HTH domain
MIQLPSFQQIEERAARAGTTITALCRAEGIARSTYERWRAGKTMPNTRTLTKFLQQLEAAERGEAVPYAPDKVA